MIRIQSALLYGALRSSYGQANILYSCNTRLLRFALDWDTRFRKTWIGHFPFPQSENHYHWSNPTKNVAKQRNFTIVPCAYSQRTATVRRLKSFHNGTAGNCTLTVTCSNMFPVRVDLKAIQSRFDTYKVGFGFCCATAAIQFEHNEVQKWVFLPYLCRGRLISINSFRLSSAWLTTLITHC